MFKYLNEKSRGCRSIFFDAAVREENWKRVLFQYLLLITSTFILNIHEHVSPMDTKVT